MNMEAHTTNMPCNTASLNWSEDDIKKIEKRQEFYSFLLDNYDADLITKAIMELNDEGKLGLTDEIEDHKDEIIEKLEKIKAKNMDNKEENKERKLLTEEQYRKELAHDINENIKEQLDQLYSDSGEFAPVFEKFEATKLDLSDATIYGPKNSNEDGKDLCGTDGENELTEEDKDASFDLTTEECDFENLCDCGGTFERCDDTAPCCGDLDDIPDVYDYLTDDMFPVEATEKDKYNKYVRRTPWTEIESYNKSNKKIVDDYIKYFRENFPDRAKDKTDIEILSENDDIWEKGLYDDLLLNSLKNGDYVLDTYSDDGYVKGGLKGKDRHDVLANFDVVIDCTLVGYVCRPYIVFGISKQHSWMANSVDDDYTREELKKISDLSGPKNDEELHWWRTEGVYKYHEREIELYKEGHIHFEIKDLGTEYRQYIRKVDHKAEKHKVTHDIW